MKEQYAHFNGSAVSVVKVVFSTLDPLAALFLTMCSPGSSVVRSLSVGFTTGSPPSLMDAICEVLRLRDRLGRREWKRSDCGVRGDE